MKKNNRSSTPARSRRKACPKVPFVSIFVETDTSWGRRVVSGIIEYARINGPWHIELRAGGVESVKALGPEWRPDGIIARVSSLEMGKALLARNVPVVNCSGIVFPGFEAPTVTGSYIGDARICAEHLWSKGLTNFAYVGRPEESYVNILYEKLQQVLAERGHTCAFHRSVPRPEMYFDWLQRLPKPVGVLCWGPAIGHMLLDACLKSGIRVPHDVAVMGCDFDELHSEASYPEQTGIRLASEQIGRTAGDVLHTLMCGGKPKKMRYELEPLGVISRLSTDTLAVSDPRIAAVMRMIQEKAHEPISVNDLLKAQPMARRSLERKFRHYFGCSVVEQIRQIRVNKLRLLLARTDEPITNLAEQCGFASYKYMGLVFSQATGMSPREFRDKNSTKRR